MVEQTGRETEEWGSDRGVISFPFTSEAYDTTANSGVVVVVEFWAHMYTQSVAFYILVGYEFHIELYTWTLQKIDTTALFG